MYKTHIFTCISIFLLFSSCARTANNPSIIDESSCNLPCWRGIIPGETTKDDYIQYINGLSINGTQSSVNVLEGKTLNIYNGVISYRALAGWPLNRSLDISIQAWWTSDNVIKYIDICGYNGKLNTTTGELIEKAGKPEFIISAGNHLGGKDVILVNPKKGLSFWYRTNDLPVDQQAKINSDTKIRCLELFDPAMYQAMTDAGLFTMGYYNAEETQKVMYVWKGYGNLEEKYPLRQP